MTNDPGTPHRCAAGYHLYYRMVYDDYSPQQVKLYEDHLEHCKTCYLWRIWVEAMDNHFMQSKRTPQND